VKKSKPPETSSVFAPTAAKPASIRSAPGDRHNRSAYTCSSALTGNPASSATRRRRLSGKSISPRIACAVIAATCGFSPCRSAISSMHSMVISVESMSIATSRTRSSNRSCGTRATS
jgi:hypothetical protein